MSYAVLVSAAKVEALNVNPIRVVRFRRWLVVANSMLGWFECISALESGHRDADRLPHRPGIHPLSHQESQ
jgi:hypothetical protein